MLEPALSRKSVSSSAGPCSTEPSGQHVKHGSTDLGNVRGLSAAVSCGSQRVPGKLPRPLEPAVRAHADERALLISACLCAERHIRGLVTLSAITVQPFLSSRWEIPADSARRTIATTVWAD